MKRSNGNSARLRSGDGRNAIRARSSSSRGRSTSSPTPARSRARRRQFNNQGEEMPYADANGVRLYYEEAGKGTPIVFVHEFAGDLRSWEPQMRHFSRRYRCIAFNARGYPPSDVPKAKTAYSQQIARDDIANVMR